jgi:ribosomal-protein-alanine N-acetyltransferase
MGESSVTLRRLVWDDWQAVHSWGSLPEFCRYQAWGPNTPEQSREFVRAALDDSTRSPQNRFAYLAILDGQPVGSGELNIRDRAHRQGEISYGIHPAHWGRGIGTSIGRQLLAQGFDHLDLHRIYATCDPRNTGSGRILAKLGMTREGRLRHTLLLRGGWRDSDLFSILEPEWAEKNHGGKNNRGGPNPDPRGLSHP